ncbi:MAG: tryptophanase [Alistipes sp.]
MELPYSEPYRIKMTEAIRTSTRAEREVWIREASYNLFKLRSEQVTIDLLTDSGTGSMSDHQWAAMMTGDESYAGATSFFRLKEMISRIFDMPYFLPTHQGRAAENVIFSALLKAGDIVPGNSHFDTTKGHIEFRHCHAIDCTIDAASDTQKELPFKGEMDIEKLEKVFKENPKEKIPCVVLTITNNTAGGQPVSMRNIRETAELCRKYGIPMLIDSARFAENAYFIKTREKGYENKTIKEIVHEIYTYADLMTISAKKDGVVNMGGFVAMRSEAVYRKAMQFSIMYEGYLTYGGMSGRDMDALAVGLDENTEYEQLDARIRQVKLLGDLLDEYGVPYQRPAGGHAIFIDAKKVLPNLPKEQFIAQTLGVELYLEAGIRGVEIGSILADRDPDTHENRYPKLELLRLAISRRVYTDNHIRVIAAACRNILERRDTITKGYKITFEAPILRHFTVEMEKVK